MEKGTPFSDQRKCLSVSKETLWKITQSFLANFIEDIWDYFSLKFFFFFDFLYLQIATFEKFYLFFFLIFAFPRD